MLKVRKRAWEGYRTHLSIDHLCELFLPSFLNATLCFMAAFAAFHSLAPLFSARRCEKPLEVLAGRAQESAAGSMCSTYWDEADGPFDYKVRCGDVLVA